VESFCRLPYSNKDRAAATVRGRPPPDLKGATVNAKDVLKHALTMNRFVLTTYLSDLSDADLQQRPGPGANYLAWQLGHLIAAEAQFFLPQIPGAKAAELPAGFAEAHAREKAASDDRAGFRTKEEYLALFGKVREATLKALEDVPEADLDKPITGQLARICPNVGSVFFLAANHEMMHAGQIAVLRRKLGKPILI
jgi:uncharacterized damage-inducible protein DinB